MKHLCHATGCKVPVPPKSFMCRAHWFSLPRELRNRVWAVYEWGQEVRKDPSDAYLAVAQEAIDYVARKNPGYAVARKNGVAP